VVSGVEATDAAGVAEAVREAGSASGADGRLRVVILNQYYEPDVASTGHLLHELASELAASGFEVQVLTSRPSYGPPETWVECPMRDRLDGVDVRRLWTTRFSKDNLLGRAVNYVTFMGQLFLRVLVTSRGDTVYLYTTNPPFLSVIGAAVSLVRRHAYVHLLHDAYPQMAVWVGTIRRRGLAERVWHGVNRLCYRRCERAIVLCQKAKSLVSESYGVDREKIHVIPNWADGAVLKPIPKRESAFAREHGLQDKFVVMYSGNLGLYYEFETVLDASERLDPASYRLVLIGAGGKRAWIAEQIERRGMRNTLLLPYQPFEKLNESLNAADASLVTIAEGIEGISFPSKLYTSLAVGRPVLALSEPDSELRALVEEHGVGLWCELGDADGMEANIRALMTDREAAGEMGIRARRLFETLFTKQACSGKYAEVLLASHPEAGVREASHHESIGAGARL